MKYESSKGILISRESIQTEFLMSGLLSELNLKLSLVDCNYLSKPINFKKFDLVVIDYEMLEQLNEQHHFHISCNVSKVPIIIINCEDSINLEEVALWTSVMGIFYIKDYIETLYRGFSFVIDGNIWLSRGVSQKLLNIYRSKIKIEDTTQDCLLTKREWQILKLVGNGLTNSEISNQIHVAEGTVKTHVYNIYKKVRVKNRVEAILWLKSVEGNLETELKHKAILERFNDG
ncbi:response regulator transcription factor [Vibrio sp. 10N.261.46.E12]|uniref:helix-turn-helix transcriptional regulator n=1 Tax=unclassified Vibrio TaxID=2614977 RepID=UPI00097825D3|nr:MULTISPECIES: response regulator transcription factor [unclassified Vibrio]OMO36707.1 hypothetical protein BH584_25170 [Vibrio sp. 10N.261.45.E1]PMJ29643.1 hypothetical protein BCU27_25985 [Vibrio sp. 10N.286.45.B6]PMM72924.1 hypothetical protein BCT48_05300 [Vibrio sp. 10N.261.46.F12]PMM90545.1 hypothetical protein BCT46_22165 [Vibrio sp. 10N.261.46.E8]PMN39051.1 hypothetical protein BCT34_23580 [Vibrio sp. 10N.261.45.E2]